MNTTQYKTERTNREYTLVFSKPGMYAGTYDLAISVKDIHNNVCKELNIDPDGTEPDPDQLDFDAMEIAAYALHILTTENMYLLGVERLKIQS
jgi:hypothetical protein